MIKTADCQVFMTYTPRNKKGLLPQEDDQGFYRVSKEVIDNRGNDNSDNHYAEVTDM